jgi:hypothetical protein
LRTTARPGGNGRYPAIAGPRSLAGKLGGNDVDVLDRRLSGEQGRRCAQRVAVGRDLRNAGTGALEGKIGAAVRAGELPPGTSARALARFYAATLQGMSAQARDGATRSDLERIAGPARSAWPGTN